MLSECYRLALAAPQQPHRPDVVREDLWGCYKGVTMMLHSSYSGVTPVPGSVCEGKRVTTV
jgi:hypothetical protein